MFRVIFAPSAILSASVQTTGRTPTLIEFRKKIRANDCAMTTFTPAPMNASGACSREEPQPKFLPPTTMSPSFTFFANSSRVPSKACVASSSGLLMVRNRPGMIASVSMLSPNFHTRAFFVAGGLSWTIFLTVPDFCCCHHHTSRGSVISPVIALAAAVAGEQR